MQGMGYGGYWREWKEGGVGGILGPRTSLSLKDGRRTICGMSLGLCGEKGRVAKLESMIRSGLVSAFGWGPTVGEWVRCERKMIINLWFEVLVPAWMAKISEVDGHQEDSGKGALDCERYGESEQKAVGACTGHLVQPCGRRRGRPQTSST